jgi:Ulp1 family protease
MARLVQFLEQVDSKWRVTIDPPHGVPQTVSVSSLKTMTSGNHWVNDEIVNGFMAAMQRRSIDSVLIFSSFLYDKLERDGPEGARKWTQRATAGVDLTQIRTFLMPVCVCGHWRMTYMMRCLGSVGLGIVNGDGSDERVFRVLQRFAADFFKMPVYRTSAVPSKLIGLKQMDGHSCGLYACMSAALTALDIPHPHQTREVWAARAIQMRFRVAWEILAASVEHGLE